MSLNVCGQLLGLDGIQVLLQQRGVHMIQNGLVADFLKADVELYAAVLGATGLGLVVGNRFLVAITMSGQLGSGNAGINQILTNSLCAFLTQLLIHLGLTYVVGVSLNLYLIARVRDEGHSDLVQDGKTLLLDYSLAGLELDTRHGFLQQGLHRNEN